MKEAQVRHLESPHGRLILVEPESSKNPPITAIFPGFTGDAWTHQVFIKAAAENGIASLCVTPKWATSTARIRENIEELAQLADNDSSIHGRIRFIRGVSYGSYLSLYWLAALKDSIQKIAWITPCSNPQVLIAAKKMHMPLTGDDTNHPNLERLSPDIRVITLHSDSIVPCTDPIFETLSATTERLTIQHTDHFSAGDTPEASLHVAHWFGGRI